MERLMFSSSREPLMSARLSYLPHEFIMSINIIIIIDSDIRCDKDIEETLLQRGLSACAVAMAIVLLPWR